MTRNISQPDEMDFDIVDLTQFTNDGKVLTGQAVLCALDGGLVPVYFTYARGDVAARIQPEPFTSASALLWLELHGMADLRNDAEEALSEQRDWLRDLDVQSGPNIAYSWDDWSVT